MSSVVISLLKRVGPSIPSPYTEGVGHGGRDPSGLDADYPLHQLLAGGGGGGGGGGLGGGVREGLGVGVGVRGRGGR